MEFTDNCLKANDSYQRAVVVGVIAYTGPQEMAPAGIDSGGAIFNLGRLEPMSLSKMKGSKCRRRDR
jgi:hypothetical protein